MCTRLCLALFNCGYDISYLHVTVLPAFFWIALLTLGQSYDCLVSGMWARSEVSMTFFEFADSWPCLYCVI